MITAIPSVKTRPHPPDTLRRSCPHSSNHSSPLLMVQTDRWRLGSSSRLWGKLVPDMLMQGEIHPRHFIPSHALRADTACHLSTIGGDYASRSTTSCPSPAISTNKRLITTEHTLSHTWPSRAIHALCGLCRFGSAGLRMVMCPG